MKALALGLSRAKVMVSNRMREQSRDQAMRFAVELSARNYCVIFGLTELGGKVGLGLGLGLGAMVGTALGRVGKGDGKGVGEVVGNGLGVKEGSGDG